MIPDLQGVGVIKKSSQAVKLKSELQFLIFYYFLLVFRHNFCTNTALRTGYGCMGLELRLLLMHLSSRRLTSSVDLPQAAIPQF